MDKGVQKKEETKHTPGILAWAVSFWVVLSHFFKNLLKNDWRLTLRSYLTNTDIYSNGSRNHDSERGRSREDRELRQRGNRAKECPLSRHMSLQGFCHNEGPRKKPHIRVREKEIWFSHIRGQEVAIRLCKYWHLLGAKHYFKYRTWYNPKSNPGSLAPGFISLQNSRKEKSQRTLKRPKYMSALYLAKAGHIKYLPGKLMITAWGQSYQGTKNTTIIFKILGLVR